VEYHKYSLEYLQAYKKAYAASGSLNSFVQSSIIPFSSPDEAGYNNTSITNDLIRDVYMAFIDGTRSKESGEYLCSLTPGTSLSPAAALASHQSLVGICLSVDNTFKAASKATVADSSKTRTKLMKGGILSVLNECNEIIAWVHQFYSGNKTAN
jgi:hypothetical protein